MSRNREDERQGLAVVWDGASWKKRWELFVTIIFCMYMPAHVISLHLCQGLKYDSFLQPHQNAKPESCEPEPSGPPSPCFPQSQTLFQHHPTLLTVPGDGASPRKPPLRQPLSHFVIGQEQFRASKAKGGDFGCVLELLIAQAWLQPVLQCCRCSSLQRLFPPRDILVGGGGRKR